MLVHVKRLNSPSLDNTRSKLSIDLSLQGALLEKQAEKLGQTQVILLRFNPNKQSYCEDSARLGFDSSHLSRQQALTFLAIWYSHHKTPPWSLIDGSTCRLKRCVRISSAYWGFDWQMNARIWRIKRERRVCMVACCLAGCCGDEIDDFDGGCDVEERDCRRDCPRASLLWFRGSQST